MTDKAETTVLGCFAEIVGVDAPRGMATTPHDVGTWDSLAQVHLVHLIESRLSITLPDDALTTRTTLADLADFARLACSRC